MDFLLQALALHVEVRDLFEQKATQLANRVRQVRVRILKRRRQAVDMSGPLGRNHAELREVAAQRVDRLGALTHQQIAYPEQHPPTLLLRRLDRHKIHRRTRCRLADRLGVRCVVLLTLDVRLDILWWDQPHRVTQIADLPAPVMSAGAGLHRHRAARLRCHKFQYFPAAQLLAERNRSIGPRAVQLKAVLRQINSDHANFVHGRPFPLLALTPLPTWHIAMPSGGASTPSVMSDGATLSSPHLWSRTTSASPLPPEQSALRRRSNDAALSQRCASDSGRARWARPRSTTRFSRRRSSGSCLRPRAPYSHHAALMSLYCQGKLHPSSATAAVRQRPSAIVPQGSMHSAP